MENPDIKIELRKIFDRHLTQTEILVRALNEIAELDAGKPRAIAMKALSDWLAVPK